MRVRRTAYAMFRLESNGQTVALAPLVGREAPVSDAEMTALRGISAEDWTDAAALDQSVVQGLVEKGLLLVENGADAGDGGAVETARRDALLQRTAWHPLAAAFHFTTRMRGVAMDDPSIDDAWVSRFGPSPSPFKSVGDPAKAIELPLLPAEGNLYDAMRQRRTTRFYDTSKSVTLDQLSQILRWTFGVQGTYQQHPQHLVVHKAGPSPSGLHATEAYPALVRVDGVEPGIYHYNTERHALEPIRLMPADDLSQLLASWAVSQKHPGEAAATCILTQRYGRMFYKYRGGARAYGVMLKDVGVLAQTFYLVASHQGLASFLLTAINDWEVDEVLGLDSYAEGAVGMLGIGHPVPNHPSHQLQPTWEPFTPRRGA